MLRWVMKLRREIRVVSECVWRKKKGKWKWWEAGNFIFVRFVEGSSKNTLARFVRQSKATPSMYENIHFISAAWIFVYADSG